MAFESEEIRKRQQRRKQEAQRRKEQQQRFRKRLILGLIAAAVVLALSGLVILLLQNDATPAPTEQGQEIQRRRFQYILSQVGMAGEKGANDIIEM